MLFVFKKFMVEVQLLHHFIMSSKGIHRTSNKKFSTSMQLSNRHPPQIKICEALHFCVISELVAYKLIFFCQNKQVFVSLKLQEMCILAI